MGKLKVGSTLSNACGECGSDMVLRNSKYGLFYGCTKFPSCRGTHTAHQNSGKPMGTPADAETKEWRMIAHDKFDKLWQGIEEKGIRKKAYRLMQVLMNMTAGQAHISKFDVKQCQELVKKLEGIPSDWYKKEWSDAI